MSGIILRGFGVFLVATGSMACSTTATIYRSNGMMMEGSIEGGSPSSITVTPNYGAPQEVPRSDITEIDHPGNVHALVGGIVLAYGVANIAVGMEECERQGGAFCVGVFTPAVIGTGMLIWGLATWIGSNSAADDTSLPSMDREPSREAPASTLPPANAVKQTAPAPAPTPAEPQPAAPAPSAPPPASPPVDEPMVPVPTK